MWFKISSLEPCKDGFNPNGSEIDVIDHLTNPCRYEKWFRPNRGNKTTVFVHMHVFSIGPVDAQNLRYTTQILLRFRWSDSRLRPDRFIQYADGLSDRIWSPHIYIKNEQESTVMGSSQKDIMSSIWPDGTVVHLSRMKVTLQCVMNLQKFPFDSQRCPLIMESWSYNETQMELAWEQESPVTVDSQLTLPEYSLVDILINSATSEYSHKAGSSFNVQYSAYYGKAAGKFSILSVHFALQRQYGFYIMDYYVPSILIVVVSWVTFWLDANSTPGRTVLGTSTLLTFITLSRNIGSSLPKVSYIKSSEIWFIGCTVFIFSSLTEFAFVNIIWRRKKSVNLKKMTGKHILQSTLTPQIYHKQVHLAHSKSFPSISTMNDSQYGSSLNSRDHLATSVDSISPEPFPHRGHQDEIVSISFPVPNLQDEPNEKSLFTMTPQEIADWIDRRSRLLFPIAFIVFNCVYWTWTLVLF